MCLRNYDLKYIVWNTYTLQKRSLVQWQDKEINISIDVILEVFPS